jgi:FAD/FMN-containing dehydrogenase
MPAFYDTMVPAHMLFQTSTWIGATLRCPFAVFGHVGKGFVHVHLFPENFVHDHAAREFEERLATYMVANEMVPAAVLGVGRRRQACFRNCQNSFRFNAMLRIKQELDPQRRLNKGCLLPSF